MSEEQIIAMAKECGLNTESQSHRMKLIHFAWLIEDQRTQQIATVCEQCNTSWGRFFAGLIRRGGKT